MSKRPVRPGPAVLLLGMALICASAAPLQSQEPGGDAQGTASPSEEMRLAERPRTVEPVKTGSPRETFATFQRLAGQLEDRLATYRQDKTRANADRLELLAPQFVALIDMSAVPPASWREVGMDTTSYLLDILGRVELPALEEVPEEDAFGDDAVAKWRIPHTPLRIMRIEDGPREGEFLFSNRTVSIAPTFFERIKDFPLRTSLGIDSWSRALPQVTGPAIPAGLVTAVPAPLKRIWLDTPLWKILAVVLLNALAVLLAVLVYKLVGSGPTDRRTTALLRRTLTPIVILVLARILVPITELQINITGAFAGVVDTATTVVVYAAAIWLLWLVVMALFEQLILARGVSPDSFDAHLWRLGGRVLAIAGVLVIVAQGASELGLPLYSVLAGLGIGGLAVALAIRPTLENLIGGIILYVDQPIRVGDFCSFGDKTGTVERIGIRSTRLRAPDRTLITVPNASLADMQLINYARCDKMLINTTIGLRYETAADQLRYVLVQMREMLHAHPKIEEDTVRVRFSGYGASSLDVAIRIYALTRDWNEYHAIREDILLRIKNLVEGSGTGFAFPSQTLYLGRDDGLDKDLEAAAVGHVEAWRRSGKLPFPRLSKARIDQIRGSLDFPPKGSVERRSEPYEAAEPLSAPRPPAPDEQST